MAIRHKESAPFFDPRQQKLKVLLFLLLSLLLHLLILEYLHPSPPLDENRTAGSVPLTVSLAGPVAATESRAAAPVTPPEPELPTPPRSTRAPPTRPPRPLLTMPSRSPFSLPATPPRQTPLPPIPQTAQNGPPQDDMMARVSARREQRAAEEENERALEANGGSEESDAQRAQRIALANIKATSGNAQDNHTGGVFEITDKGLHTAQFTFHGWNKDFHRDWGQEIDVSQGSEPSIELAIVDRMIDIIREYEQGDFIWDSRRLGHTVKLSARKEDTAGLEDFLMKEFDFDGAAERPAAARRRRG